MNIGIFGDQRFLYDSNGNFYTKGNLRGVLLEEYAKHFDKIYLFFRTKQSDLSWAPKKDLIRNNKIEFVHLPTFEGLLGFSFNKNKIEKIIEDNIEKCDVCILRFCYKISCLAAPIAAKHKKPTIAHIRGHGYESMMYDIERIPFYAARRFFAFLNWKSNSKHVRMCDRIIGTSKAVADIYAEPGRNTLGIADGCTTQDFFLPFRRRTPGKPVNILVVARINYAKNVQQLVRAMARIKAMSLNATLTIVGDGPYHDELKHLAHTLKISHMVHFAGRVNSRNELIEYYRAAHIGALTSLTEGLPSSVLESMAASLPIVCTDLLCMKEIITEGTNGFLVKVGDDGECANKLAILIKDEAVRERMGISANKVAESFRTDKQVALLANLVLELKNAPVKEIRK